MRPADPRLLRHAAAARGYLVLTVALGLATTGLILAQAGLLAHALAAPTAGLGVAALASTLGVLLAVLAARAVTAYGGELAALRAAAAVKSQLRRKLTAHVLRLGPAWLGGQRSGEITTLSTKGLDALDPYFARFLPQLVLAFVVPVAVLARVGLADWISALVIAVTLPIIPVFAVLIGLQTRAQTERQWRLLARLGGHFLDVVEGLPTLKLFGRAQAQVAVIREVTDAHRRATMRTLRVAFLSALVLELSAAIATALVAVEVGLRLLAGHIPYQTALLVLLLTPEAYLPLRAVGMQFHASMEGVTAAGRACEILDTPVPQALLTEAPVPQAPLPEAPLPEAPLPEAPRLETSTAAPAGRGLGSGPPPQADLRRDLIFLNGTSLVYPGRDAPALDRVSLVIRPGERIAVTGPSGAGKSSLLALLLRFAAPTGGRIEAGPAGGPGTDIAAFDVAAWRRQIAWVPQHPYLFDGTVASNIALGRPDAPPADIARAATLAGAAEFIGSLPGEYATPLGERGARLSAGQRQRIALARAFLQDAPLLLLDEPAAHLDPLTARMIIDTIERLMAGRTVLLITHGPGWLGGAGRTLTLDQGRLVLAAGCFGTVPGGTGPGGTGPGGTVPGGTGPGGTVPGGTGPGSTGSGGHALAASS
jgi:ATP-binding cassette subfamily C protein CydD